MKYVQHNSFKDKNLIILSFLFIFLIIIKNDYITFSSVSIDNNELENEFKTYLCQLLNDLDNQDCLIALFNNLNFFNEKNYLNKTFNNISLLIELNKTNIENLLIIIVTIPFVKNNSFISFNIKNKKTLNIIKNIFANETLINNCINSKKYDYNQIKSRVIKFLNYKWELIPNKKILNIIRYILDKYYDEAILELFDGYLNLNFKYYLKSNILSFDEMKNLMSKL